MANGGRRVAKGSSEYPIRELASFGRLRSVPRRFGLVIVASLVPLLAAACFFVKRTLPTIDGSLRVAGLRDKVEVLRDRWGVPHIFARSARDAYFSQGYVTAQDRLWQMELFRRAGRGTLSEVFGRIPLDDDRLVRTLGLWRVARQEADSLDPDSKQILEAYAAGVNAFVMTHGDRLPLEFTILGFKPEAWSPPDTLVFAKLMALDLCGNWRLELLRVKLLARFGPDALRELAPPCPADAPIVVPPGIQVAAFGGGSFSSANHSLAHPFGTGADIGSNNWVIDGTLSATGRPLLANDPHLGIQMPGLWYEVHLNSPESDDAPALDVAGASLPGVPGVVIGHNRRIAWGMTNLGADVQDLYVEKVNPENPVQYEFKGRWEDAQVIEEVIKVRGEPQPIELKVLLTRHGPLLNAVVKGIGLPVALRWTALDPGQTFRAMTLLNRAGNWEEFRSALRNFAVPAQNFVYADVDGNIGYLAPGAIPIRDQGDGLLPVPGWTGEYEWNGYVPFESLPSAYNPAEHFLLTANNRVVDGRYPYFISHDWNPGYRARRIEQIMQGRQQLNVADLRRMQLDTHSLPLVRLAGLFDSLTWCLPFPPGPARLEDAFLARALQQIREWNGDLESNSVAGAILEVTLTKLLQNVYADAMGAELFDEYADTEMAVPCVLALLENGESYWFDNVRSAALSDRREVALCSLRDAIAELRRRFGDHMAGWRWGRLHTITFAHPLGQVKPLDRLFNLGPFEIGGSRNTIAQTAYLPSKSFAVNKSVSLRQIVDLGDFDRSLFVHTTGQSGQPFSHHFGDLADLWRRGEYHPMLFSREKIEAHLEGRLTLTP